MVVLFSSSSHKNHSHGHGFSEAVMASLSAVCDTFLPSCNPPPNISCHGYDDDGVQSFFQLSASEAQVPQHVAELMSMNIDALKTRLITTFLCVLSSPMGTFLLFGTPSLSRHFPYLRRFADIPLPKREQLLLSWSHSPHHFLRLIFKVLKAVCMFSFYTKLDNYNYNPCWHAIDYSGPDPEAGFATNIRQGGAQNPLNSVIDAASTSISLKYLNFNFKQSHHERDPMGIKCDVVIVGSGSGGGVCAGVLAKSLGLKVVIIEKGKYMPRNTLSLLEGPSMQNMYERGAMFLTENGEISVLAGSVVGGGSVVNWGASFKTPPHVLKEWAEIYKLDMFSSSKFQKALDIACDRIGVVTGGVKENLCNRVLRKGCQKLGYHVDDVPLNSDSDHFCGWCGFGCWNGKKQATTETWLKDATDAGAILLSDCKALQVVQRENMNQKNKSKRAIGLIASFGKHRLFIEAEATVIACGSLHTPGLLLKSGLKNSNIGKHLHLHIVENAWGYFPEADGKSYEGNIISAFSRQVGTDNIDGSVYETINECPSMHPGGFASSIPWISGIDHKERMRKFAKTVHIFALVRDRGSGSVNSRGAINYEVDGRDEKMLREGVEKALRVLIAAGAEEVGTHHVDGDRMKVKGASDEEIEEFVKKAVREKDGGKRKKLSRPLFSAHQMGSCRMGCEPKTSVVDGRGETWEVEGLFVADASVFPTSLGVNPMLTIQAIAYCVSQNVLEYVKKRRMSVGKEKR